MISNLTEEEMKMYDESLKRKRDWQNALATKKEEGKIEERRAWMEERRKMIEEKKEMIRQLKRKNVSIKIIAEVTGLSIDEINKL